MTISRQHKEKLGNNKVSQDDCMEGTSARTRPISYDDIMLRRKTREDAAKQAADVQTHIASSRDYSEKAHSPESCGQLNEDFIITGTKYTSDNSQKLSSWKKGDSGASNRDEKLVEDKDIVVRDTKIKLKSIISSNRTSEGKSEAHNHQNTNKDGRSSYDYDDGSYHRVNDFVRKELISERSSEKSKLNRKVLDNEGRQVYRNWKTDKFTTGNPEKDSKKRNGRDIIHTDNFTDGRRDKSEKETKHKRHNEEDKTRGRTAGKKHNSETKGMELMGAHHEKSKVRRNRSQSRERNKQRGKRSPSHSPKEHKHSTKYKRHRGESPSHFPKDRPARDHSDVVNKRISGNGSSGHKRHMVSSSGLGGYSPRKRKSNAAAKTPSPSRRSPEKKIAGWGLPPDGKDSIVTNSTFSLHASDQNSTLNVYEFPHGIPVTPAIVKPIGISHLTLSSQMHAVDSIQLTQATRPMRRLYIENLPASATEKDLMECINNLFLSSGFSYVQGTQPCISCIIHKEKGQALLEFLTPEDASVALSFGGKSFFGCNLRIRRPKDYTEVIVQTGPPDKSLVAVDSVSNVVEDSPHKIFIGGISKVVSSEMLLEIARVFGPLKAYHFEFIGDSDEPCAFLEYVDHSVTTKACTGLNGIRLGGRVLTAVLAAPDAALLENVGKLPFYGIPELAMPLLMNPTSVLKFQNMLDPEGLLSLSDTGLEEIMEDIKLECSRFGAVISINVVKPSNSSGMMEAYEVQKVYASTDGCGLEFDSMNYSKEQLNVSTDELVEDRLDPEEIPSGFEINKRLEDNKGVDASVEPEEISRWTVIGDGFSEEIVAEKPVKNETCEPSSADGNASVENPPFQENSGGCNVQLSNKQNYSEVEFDHNDKNSKTIATTNTKEPFFKDELISKEDVKTVNLIALESDARKYSDVPENDCNKDTLYGHEDLFEPGSVLIEYKRAEAACTAAHCLHGRLFDGRVVAVTYVDHDLYQRRFRR